MSRKLPPEERATHIGMRLRTEDRERIERVAHKLHKRGVGGMINLEGEPIATNVIRYLLKEADEREEDKGEKE